MDRERAAKINQLYQQGREVLIRELQKYREGSSLEADKLNDFLGQRADSGSCIWKQLLNQVASQTEEDSQTPEEIIEGFFERDEQGLFPPAENIIDHLRKYLPGFQP